MRIGLAVETVFCIASIYYMASLVCERPIIIEVTGTFVQGPRQDF